MKEYVKIKGKNYPVNFGSWCHREFENDVGVSMSALDFSTSTTGSMLDIVYHGLKDGARIDKIPFDFEKTELADLLDEEGEKAKAKKETSAVAKIGNIWLKSMGYNQIKYKDGLPVIIPPDQEEEQPDTAKKKNGLK